MSSKRTPQQKCLATGLQPDDRRKDLMSDGCTTDKSDGNDLMNFIFIHCSQASYNLSSKTRPHARDS